MDDDRIAAVIAEVMSVLENPQSRGMFVGWLAAKLDSGHNLGLMDSAARFANEAMRVNA